MNKEKTKKQKGDYNDSFHKDFTRTYYTVADANWGMYAPERFKSISAAKKYIREQNKIHAKDPAQYSFWLNRRQVILRNIEIVQVVSKPL